MNKLKSKKTIYSVGFILLIAVIIYSATRLIRETEMSTTAMKTEEETSNRFHNKVVFITGGTTGIGLATAKHLARTGRYLVYATARDPSTATELQELAAKVDNLRIMQLDVTSRESVHRAAS